MSRSLTDFELHLFGKGNYYKLYEKLGAHPVEQYTDEKGFQFAVWAPNATFVSVIGDFNDWNGEETKLISLGSSGIWSGIDSRARNGQAYKFLIKNETLKYESQKADPLAFFAETAPKTASRLYLHSQFNWTDSKWLEKRKNTDLNKSPLSIYEIHLPSWKKIPEEMNRSLSFFELSQVLPEYLLDLGFTHVEFMPPFEHPFEGSWGYQVTGYFASLSRLGTPDEFKGLINAFHEKGIGVIIDWVPAHFPNDSHALSKFDGTSLYEHENPQKGFHPDWQTLIFNYGRNEVSNFLISSALYWCDIFHIDGIRVDAVASMLYLDYSRKQGEWIPNIYGGRENLEAIEFIKHFNSQVKEQFPGVITIAEESTAWPKVTENLTYDGLGFDFKWNMGWMHDTLTYFSKDPIYRSYHHDKVTFGLLYAFSEKFVLPFSHDEVVHGKGSLIEKMPGDVHSKFSHLRMLLSLQYFYPGKKLLFMGTEFAQSREWSHDRSLDWELNENNLNSGIFKLIQDLNNIYKQYNSLFELDDDFSSFQWISCEDVHQSVFSFYRQGSNGNRVVVVLNATPIERQEYKIGVDKSTTYKEIFNSNSQWYGGSGVGNLGKVDSSSFGFHGRTNSINIFLPPLSIIAFEELNN
jgi:1,4-alpha-glucan branching enzyme